MGKAAQRCRKCSLEKICAEKEGRRGRRSLGLPGLSTAVTRGEILAAGAALPLQTAPGRLKEISVLGTVSVNADFLPPLPFFPLLNGNWGFEHHQRIPKLAQQSCLLAVPFLRAVLLNLAAA